MVFNNVRFETQNFSHGPESALVYSIDHNTDSMLVKTDPGGVLDNVVPLINTLSLDTSIDTEVLTLQYDGFYFWSQRNIGTGAGVIGTRIEKWLISEDGTTLEKQTGLNSEFALVDTVSQLYRSEAMAIHTLERSFTLPTSSGSTAIPISSTDLIEIGDSIYLGPNNAGDREDKTVIGISGSNILLNTPTNESYNTTDPIFVRKALYVFNNANGTDLNSGQLRRYDTRNSSLISVFSSGEWKDVTAADSSGEILFFVRDSQLLYYKPIGTSKGYQSSALINNMSADKTTINKVYDLSVEDNELHKLQKLVTEYSTGSEEFFDTNSTDNRFNIEREFLVAQVKSITVQRGVSSVLLGSSEEVNLKVIVRDQFNIPVFARSLSVSENDATGFIRPGFESITTDSNGSGDTIYNTGLSPDFAIPLVKVIDLASDYRVNFPLVQTAFVDNSFFTKQVGTISNLNFISQYVNEYTKYLLQRVTDSSVFPVQQFQEEPISIPLDQVKADNILPVQQILEASNIALVDQLPTITALTSLQQYTFLIFAIPLPFSQKNNPATNILVRIIGFGSVPLNTSTLVFEVNGIDVADDVTITSFGGGLQIEYDPPEDFDYASRVTMYIEIQDTSIPPNTVSTRYYFDIIPDYISPTITQVFPPDNSVDNPNDTQVFAIIEDLETGINPDTIEFYVEGEKVVYSIETLSDTAFKVSYIPSCPFPYESEITAFISASDNSGNSVLRSWSFYVQESKGVLFIDKVPNNCEVLVPVDTEICSEVFGLEEGINIDSLEFEINGKTVNFVIKPKVYRKE